MAKIMTFYECQKCGYQSPKWLGRCVDCGSWNSLIESRESSGASPNKEQNFYTLSSELKPITEVDTKPPPRIKTGLGELDRLLGGGLVPGSVILLGGDPGIGKSTLVLQLLHRLAQKSQKVIYLSGEESADQIKIRAKRLKIHSPNLLLITENDLNQALSKIEPQKPSLLVVDSIQTIYQSEINSVPGSVTQVRECTGKLLYMAKSRGISVVLVGHVTKEGSLAGPKILEHMVDTVLYFEGEKGQSFRVLRTFKNRFGSVSELAIFDMTTEGLLEVTNPSELFLSNQAELKPGSVVLTSLQGTRPILAELQALVSPSSLGVPRRVVMGVDSQRVALLAAVLEKVAGLSLGNQDIFINVVGGLDVDEPAVDLGVLMALASSFQGRQLPNHCVILGEVGLNGEIRPVAGLETRLEEAKRLGFQRAIAPKIGKKSQVPKSIEYHEVENVELALDFLS